jgi:hypothetical protein
LARKSAQRGYIARPASTDVAEGLDRDPGEVVWQRIQNGLRLSRESAHADPAKRYAYAITLLAGQSVLHLAPLTRNSILFCQLETDWAVPVSESVLALVELDLMLTLDLMRCLVCIVCCRCVCAVLSCTVMYLALMVLFSCFVVSFPALNTCHMSLTLSDLIA